MEPDSASSPPPPPLAGETLASRRRRNRPALSCIQCRARKIRCDRNEPCASCVKSKIVNCTYEEARRPKPRRWNLLSPEQPASAEDLGPDSAEDTAGTGGGVPTRVAAGRFAVESPGREDRDAALDGNISSLGSSTAPGPTSSSSGRPTVDAAAHSALADRVRQLERQLGDALKRREDDDAKPRDSALSNTQGAFAKTRYFGINHWMNVGRFFPIIYDIITERLEKEKDSAPYRSLLKCKNLARSVKAARLPRHFTTDIGQSIPPEETARGLVEAYFRTFETVFRILHVPTFWREYERYWQDPDNASPVFVLQLQLCMAIGSCLTGTTHNAEAAGTTITGLRRTACRWVYEAQFWLALPPEKSRLTLAALQVRCLLHLARETCGAGGDLTWISAGSLMRTAIFMGFHRDPDRLPKMPPLRAELRRRLWATILEITLQSSLDSGGPPLLLPTDFDTHAPSNFDDEQLVDDSSASVPVPVPRPATAYTPTTIQIALLRSFPLRLAIAQYVSSFRVAASYDETLRWNAELTSACRALSATLQQHSSTGNDSAGSRSGVSPFQLKLAEHMVHRFFLALNHPWLALAERNPAYYFARKVCVETSLKLYRDLAGAKKTNGDIIVDNDDDNDDFVRLADTGSGAIRTITFQVLMIAALELLWQASEERAFRRSLNHDVGGARRSAVGSGVGVGSGAAPLTELLGLMRHMLGFTERRILAGETSVKGHLFAAAVLSQVEGLDRDENDAELEKRVYDGATDILEHCWDLLKRAAGEETTPPGMDGSGGGVGDENNDHPLTVLDNTPLQDTDFGFGMVNAGWGDFAQDQTFNFNFNFGPLAPLDDMQDILRPR